MNEAIRERRSQKRFQPSKDLFLAFRPGFERVGRILDVSSGGIGVEYATDLEPLQQGIVMVDVFSQTGGSDGQLSRLTCQVVYDVDEPTGFAWKNIFSRRCGLRFWRLTEEQLQRLDDLLNQCASAPA